MGQRTIPNGGDPCNVTGIVNCDPESLIVVDVRRRILDHWTFGQFTCFIVKVGRGIKLDICICQRPWRTAAANPNGAVRQKQIGRMIQTSQRRIGDFFDGICRRIPNLGGIGGVV